MAGNQDTRGRYENGFRAPGIDTDISDPQNLYRQLYADLRYLGNSAQPRIEQGKSWGEWDEEALKTYFARVADTLAEAGRPISVPEPGSPKWETSYWRLYRKAEPYMKSQNKAANLLLAAKRLFR